MHVPFDVEDTVAVARFQLCSHRTGTLVNLYLILVVDIAEGIVARDGVTAAHELILLDVVLRNEDRLLAVELLGYDEEILFRGTFFLLLLAYEGHVLAPAQIFLFFVLARELIEIFLAQQHHLLAQCQQELATLRIAVEL